MPDESDVQQAQSSRLGTAERTGLLAATVSMAPSLQRGLLPRSSLQQAGVTGVLGAINYGSITTLETVIESIAFRVAGSSEQDRAGRRGVMAVGNLAAIAGGIGLQRALAQHPRESMLRAGIRSWGWRASVGGTIGLVTVAMDEAVSRVRRKPVTGAGVPGTLLLGVGAATGLYWDYRRQLAAQGVEFDALGQPVGLRPTRGGLEAVGVGIGVTGLLYAGARLESLLASGIGLGVGYVVPGLAPVGKSIGHVAALAALGYGGLQAVNRVDRMTEKAGVSVEPAYATTPTSPYVSGGPNSLVDSATIGREGRRFVNMTLSPEEIEAVMGEPAQNPIRAFVGLETVPSSAERADLAVRELEALGAFDRKTLCMFSPTGTGYVNYVACESLEYLTRGDVASVALQYSVLPSFLSLDRVAAGQDNTRAFLTALKWRVAALPKTKRPRLLMFGESLGSHVGQDSLAIKGGYGHELYGIDRLLFIGSPWGSGWRRRWLADPDSVDPEGLVVEVSDYDEWLALDKATRDRARIVLLSHHSDPIPKFGPTLAIQSPDWLGDPETRPPGVPKEVRWSPLNTFFITLLDILNADQGAPGKFEALGHDYKADLARFTQLAWRLPASDEQMDAIERALRRRELEWAELRLRAETAAASEAKVRETLGKWGVDTSTIPPVVAAPESRQVDPFAAASA
jgi:uncharacterized membrane protein